MKLSLGVSTYFGSSVEFHLGPNIIFGDPHCDNSFEGNVFGPIGYVSHVLLTHYLVPNLGGCVPTYVMFGTTLDDVL